MYTEVMQGFQYRQYVEAVKAYKVRKLIRKQQSATVLLEDVTRIHQALNPAWGSQSQSHFKIVRAPCEQAQSVERLLPRTRQGSTWSKGI